MIPLNGAPANLTIASDTYPVASKDGHAVASLPGVPAQITLPIACAKLVRAN